MCRLLDIPRATYYRKTRPIHSRRIEQQELLDRRVSCIYHESDCIYGAGEIRYLLA